ncbi:MAG TPA: hypothetical protein VJH92_00845 [Candidatus Nanoarchaeia archaeon]|nr:hypothetical protein [Candidatus Nanoarchaeia archaeon]
MKNKKIEKDFMNYFFVGLVIDIFWSMPKLSGFSEIDTLLILISTASIAMAGFSFYFYVFNKDETAKKVYKILIGVAVIFILFAEIFFIGLTSSIYLRLLLELGLYLIGFFLSGIVIYLLTLFVFWAIRKIK